MSFKQAPQLVIRITPWTMRIGISALVNAIIIIGERPYLLVKYKNKSYVLVEQNRRFVLMIANMKGQSFEKPQVVTKTHAGYMIVWNIGEGTTTLADNSVKKVYNYEYNTKYIPQTLTYHEVIQAIIRETYSPCDEIKLAFDRTDDATGKESHEILVANAKIWAKEITE